MSVQNRDLGPSQQRESYNLSVSAVASGGTAVALLVPFPATLATAAFNGYGLSNAPTLNLDVTRYLPAGVTTITGLITAQTILGATLAVGATVSSGASLISLQTGDVIVARLGTVTNSNITGGSLVLVLQALQDIKTHFGS